MITQCFGTRVTAPGHGVSAEKHLFIHKRDIFMYIKRKSSQGDVPDRTRATDIEICPYMSSKVPDWILSAISSIVTHFSSVDTAVFNLDL